MGKRAKKEGEKRQKQGAQVEYGDQAKATAQMERRPAFTGQPVIVGVSDLQRMIKSPIHTCTVCSSQGQFVCEIE